MKAWRERAGIFVFLLLAIGGGCAVLDKLGIFGPVSTFSHKIHGSAEDLSCTDCHTGAVSKDKAGMPRLAQCQLCHEEKDVDKPMDRRAASRFVDGKLKALHLAALPAEMKFSHKVHANANISCEQCHGDMTGRATVNSDVQVRMQQCVDCHAEKHVEPKAVVAVASAAPAAQPGTPESAPAVQPAQAAANQAAVAAGEAAPSAKPAEVTTCSTCHTQVNKNWAPPSHKENWKKHHGQVARANTGETVNTCSVCHEQETCAKCHKDEPPDNHTAFWRTRGHGIQASMDRESCAACHRSDSCETCHRESEPRNHVGTWGAPKAQHCIGCHLPVQNESCFVCHKSTPSHLEAPPKPSSPPHIPSMNCRQCHVEGSVQPPMPHVDNGSNCNTCHH